MTIRPTLGYIKHLRMSKGSMHRTRFILKAIIAVSIVSILISGCTTVSSVERDVKSIIYDDGISKQEALAIARKSIINSKLNDYYKVWMTAISDEGDYYRVRVPAFALNEQTCVLIIEKQKGEILAFWQAENYKESFDGKSPRRSIEEWRGLKKFWP